MAYLLANIGVDSGQTLHAISLNTITTTPQLKDYNELVQSELVEGEEAHSNAGDNHDINGD